MVSIYKFIKKYWFVITIVIVGIFFRLYRYDQYFMYGHDQDLAGWVVKDILIDKHLRLIGQETSTQGIFIGGLFYYLQIPFYLLSSMDPIGITFLGAVFGVGYIVGIYLIQKKVFSEKTGLIGALIYAVSFYFIFNDREIVPTQPVIFWSFALFWAFSEIIKGNIRRGLLISSVLFSLVWHLNFALILPLPLILLATLMSGKKIQIKDILVSLGLFVTLSIPLIYFELRHGFIQSKAFISSLTSDQYDIVSGYEKISRTYHLMSKNLYSIFLPPLNFLSYENIMLVFIILYFYLFAVMKKHRKIFILIGVWYLLYFLFFSFYSKRLSEYYLNGVQFIPVILASLFIDSLTGKKVRKIVALILITGIILINVNRFLTFPVNHSGYIERKAVVDKVMEDAEKMSYPCVSVSYITKPGYDLGYRYFFWLNKMHVNQPRSGSPVYTIVFPLNEKLFPVDQTFGAIGLIYPNYSIYTKEAVTLSCSGENSNLTDPMFGFTK